MDEEIGKWLLDISKYVLTGYVIAKMFGEESSTGAIVLAIVASVIVFFAGLYFLKKGKNNNKKKMIMNTGLLIMYIFLIVFSLNLVAYSKISERKDNKQ